METFDVFLVWGRSLVTGQRGGKHKEREPAPVKFEIGYYPRRETPRRRGERA